MKKLIDVVAAIIIKDNKVLSTQRATGDLKNGWEFPGGKIEKDENQIDALKREIREELNAEILVDSFLCDVKYSYEKFDMNMYCYICSLDGDFELLEHKDSKWLEFNQLDDVDWLPADVLVVEKLKNYIKNFR